MIYIYILYDKALYNPNHCSEQLEPFTLIELPTNILSKEQCSMGPFPE